MLASIGMLTFDLSGSDLKLDRTTSLYSATSSVTDGNKSSQKRRYVTYLFAHCIDKQLMPMLKQPRRQI